jgi:hypothetical protein
LNVLPTNSDKGKQDENQFDPTKSLFSHGIIDPSWIDGNPGQPGPIFRTAMADLVVAELLHDISVNLQDRELATKVHNSGKELVSGSSHWALPQDGKMATIFVHPGSRAVSDHTAKNSRLDLAQSRGWNTLLLR